MYSDIVKLSIRLAYTVSNLLTIITVDPSFVNIKNPISTFKPISHNTIYSVTIVIRDQYGCTLDFVKNQYAALALLIRKRGGE